MTEVVVTTGAISRPKLQSNHHHQQTFTQFFTGRMPFLSQCRSTVRFSNSKSVARKIRYLHHYFLLLKCCFSGVYMCELTGKQGMGWSQVCMCELTGTQGRYGLITGVYVWTYRYTRYGLITGVYVWTDRYTKYGLNTGVYMCELTGTQGMGWSQVCMCELTGTQGMGWSQVCMCELTGTQGGMVQLWAAWVQQLQLPVWQVQRFLPARNLSRLQEDQHLWTWSR